MKNRTIRMSDDVWEACLMLGGAEWIRDKIIQADHDLWSGVNNNNGTLEEIIKDFYAEDRTIRIMPSA